MLTAVALSLDAVLTPVLAPLQRWLGGLRIVAAMERGVAACPPYVALALVASPYLARQSVKVLAIVLASRGDPVAGMAVYLASRVASMLLAKRIYDAGHDKLLRLDWLESAHDWLERRNEKRLADFRSSAPYRFGARWAGRIGRRLGIAG